MDPGARWRSEYETLTSPRRACRTPSPAPRRRVKRSWSLGRIAPTVTLIVAWALFVAASAHAQDSDPGEREPTPAMSAAHMEALLETLRDDAGREKLILQLEVLLEAQRGQAAAMPSSGNADVGGTALAYLSRNVKALNVLAGEAARGLANVPAVAADLARQASDPKVRERWLEVALKLIVVIGVGFVAEWFVMRLLGQPRFHRRDRDDDNTGRRVVHLLERTLLDLAPVGAFAVAGYAALALIDPPPQAHVIALVIINANVIVRAVTVLARVVLRPRYSTFRFVDLSDENANYLFFWVRRLTVVSVYGFFLAEALPLLGVGQGAQAFVQRFIWLIVASMVVVLVLQNRQPARTWLSGAETAGGWRRIRRSFAEVWHFVAIAYVIAVYAVWAIGLPGGFEFLIRATVVTLVTGLAAYAAVGGLHKVVERGFRVNEETRNRYPRLEERVNRHRGIIEFAIRCIVVLIAALAVFNAWGLGLFDWLASETGRELVGRLITLVFVATGAIVTWELLSTVVERYLEERDEQGQLVERGARIRTFLPLIRNVVRIVLLVLVVLVVLSEIGIDIGPLLAGAGIVGLAVSFGAQSLVKDVITGFFILIEDTISIGDVVDLGGRSGVVESMTIRSVRLRDLAGNVHTVPFGEVAAVLNMTKDYSYALMEVGIAYREDVDEVIEVLREIGDGMQADEEFGPLILEPLEVLGLDSFGASSVNIRIRLKTPPIKQWMVRREFQRRMKRVFDEREIEIPFPHQTVYFGVDKSGRAPAARFALESERAAHAVASLSGEPAASGSGSDAQVDPIPSTERERLPEQK